MRRSILWRIMEIEEGVIRRGRRPRRITLSEISIILHMIRKPNSITVLLFIQNNSQFKNIAKTPPSIHRCSVHLRYCTFRFVQLRKYSPNSRCRSSSCLLAVLAMFVAIFSPSSYSWNEWNFFKFTTKTTQPHSQVFSVNFASTCRRLHFWRHFLVKHQILLQIWSSATGYPIRIGEIFGMNNDNT